MVILLGLVIYQYGYVQVRDEIAATRQMESKKMRTLEKFVNLIAEKPEIEKQLGSEKERRKNDNAKIIEAQTANLSAANLQETVKGIITGRGGSITSERVEKPDELGNFKVINVSIDAIVPDARALGDILYGIETRTPYLVVKEMDTRVRNFRDPRELMMKIKIAALTSAR